MKWCRTRLGGQGPGGLACGLIGTWLLTGGVLAASQTGLEARIETHGEPFAKVEAAPVAQARVIVYRSASAVLPAAVNVYLEGRFHTALLRGGYSEFCLGPGALAVQTAVDDGRRQHQGKREPGQRLSFAAGQVHYLRVQEGAVPILQAVMPAVAHSELAQTRQQIHVVSRAHVVQACQAPAEVPPVAAPVASEPVKPQAPRLYALETDALFEFNSAELRASGFNAIEALIQRLKTDYASVERIRVLGYTDPIGSRAVNNRLSEQRAKAVAKQLMARGMRPVRGIETEGLGSRELAKLGCGNASTPANKACHAANRRVVIVVIGARQQATGHAVH